ncbi:hypothetical protein BKA70DRAFT_1239844 [Coprinopsis sp. MPI-PUGE-AT-0042]|nr:hypothetical protein BKA70DRAFT_1239844 [Coprinopsis sp. MPI-PUGE-AT-0042]
MLGLYRREPVLGARAGLHTHHLNTAASILVQSQDYTSSTVGTQCFEPILSGLVQRYWGLFNASRDAVYLHKAIACSQKYISTAKTPDANHQLGISLRHLGEISGSKNDSEDAIEALSTAVHLREAAGDDDSPSLLLELSRALMNSTVIEPDMARLEQARKLLLRALSSSKEHEGTLQSVRTSASVEKKWTDASIVFFVRMLHEADKGNRQGMDDLIEQAKHFVHANDQNPSPLHPLLGALYALSAVAKGEAHRCHHSQLAWEEDRLCALDTQKTVASRFLAAKKWARNCRDDDVEQRLKAYERHDSQLAKRILAVSALLGDEGTERLTSGEGADLYFNGKIALTEDSAARALGSKELETLLKQAREIPGFEDFLLSTPLFHSPPTPPRVRPSGHSQCPRVPSRHNRDIERYGRTITGPTYEDVILEGEDDATHGGDLAVMSQKTLNSHVVCHVSIKCHSKIDPTPYELARQRLPLSQGSAPISSSELI